MASSLIEEIARDRDTLAELGIAPAVSAMIPNTDQEDAADDAA